MKTYKRAPDDSTQWKCPWVDCAHGMSLAGSGICSARGDWKNPKCPEYISNDDYEAQQELKYKGK